MNVKYKFLFEVDFPDDADKSEVLRRLLTELILPTLHERLKDFRPRCTVTTLEPESR